MAITNTLTVSRSVNGVPVYGTDFPAKGKKFKLTANVSKSLTIPAGNWNQIVITSSSGSNIQISPTEESLPGTSDWEDTNAQMNKPLQNVNSGDTIWFISPTDDYIYISFVRNTMP